MSRHATLQRASFHTNHSWAWRQCSTNNEKYNKYWRVTRKQLGLRGQKAPKKQQEANNWKKKNAKKDLKNDTNSPIF